MDFRLTEEQEAFRQLAQDFARREIAPVASQYDESGEFPWEIVRKAHRAGLMNLEVPEEYGGPGLGPLEVALIAEEIAAGCAGIATSLLGNGLALLPLLLYGTEDQKRRFLPEFCSEPRLAAFCLTEPNAGSDIAAVSTQARREGTGYVLDG
ncbi:MAG: acyl-CoA dehydrogenase family protein, partial [Chloroflexia bacterium]